MKPLVSILIPAYNAARHIEETLQCALAQTWPHKEVIIVDDGSTDQTFAIARRFESRSVRVVRQKNEGAAAARNRAWSLAQGDFIQWLDADDLMSPNKIQRQMAVLLREADPRILASCGWAHFYHRPHRARFLPTGLWQDLDPLDWLIRKVGDGWPMQTATWLISRELTQAAGLWNTQLLGDDDGEYFCRVKLQCKRIRFVPEAKVFYREVCTNRLSHVGRSNRKLEAHWVSMQLHIRYLLSLEDSKRTREACLRYLQRYLFYFTPNRPDIQRELMEKAASLGGRLEQPRLPWKYSWLQSSFGLSVAKRVQSDYYSLKTLVSRVCDRVLWKLGI